MKRLNPIYLFLCLLPFEGFTQQSKSDMILLVEYNENTECEVIEIDGQQVASSNHFCGGIPAIVDNFSNFYPTKKVFYFDGELELSSNSRILFWDYDYKKEIENLPFSYSKVKINALSNDTVLKIQLHNQNFELLPNQIKFDTIVITKKEKNKLAQYTTSISIKNHGLIEKKNVIDNKQWATQSVELAIDAPTSAEVMPEFEGGQEQLFEYLFSNIKYPKTNKSEIINFKLILEFIVDKEGNVTTVNVLRSINPTFDNQVIEVLENMPKWKPGLQDGKPVAVKMILPIYITLK